MANVRNSNTYYVDATGSLTVINVRVTHIFFTPDAANDQMILKDVTTGNTKLHIRAATAKTTLFFDFEANPIVFPNGIDVTTMTAGATATLIGRETRG